MPAYNTNNVNVNQVNSSQSASTMAAMLYKERRGRLQIERRDSWVSEVMKKHTAK